MLGAAAAQSRAGARRASCRAPTSRTAGPTTTRRRSRSARRSRACRTRVRSCSTSRPFGRRPGAPSRACGRRSRPRCARRASRIRGRFPRRSGRGSAHKLGLDEVRMGGHRRRADRARDARVLPRRSACRSRRSGACRRRRAARRSTRATRSGPGPAASAVAGVELRIADDGELLVRGPIVMTGYRNEPEKTAEAIDPDGWLHTGDVATIDDDGYVQDRRPQEGADHQRGRQEHVAGEHRERAEGGSHPLIGQAVVVGDRRPYIVALLVLDPDACAAYARRARARRTRRPPRSRQTERVRAAIADGVEEANAPPARASSRSSGSPSCRTSGSPAATSSRRR